MSAEPLRKRRRTEFTSLDDSKDSSTNDNDGINANSVPDITDLQDNGSLRESTILHRNNLLTFIQSDELSDVTFMVGEVPIRGIRAIFGKQSPVFKAMFFGRMYESSKLGKDDVINISDVSPDIFQLIKQSFYGINIKFCSNNVIGLLFASKIYLVEQLEIDCYKYIESISNVDEWLNVLLDLSNNYPIHITSNDECLTDALIRKSQVVVNSKTRFSKIKDNNKLYQIAPEWLSLIIRSDCLVNVKEEDIYQLCKSYCTNCEYFNSLNNNSVSSLWCKNNSNSNSNTNNNSKNGKYNRNRKKGKGKSEAKGKVKGKGKGKIKAKGLTKDDSAPISLTADSGTVRRLGVPRMQEKKSKSIENSASASVSAANSVDLGLELDLDLELSLECNHSNGNGNNGNNSNSSNKDHSNNNHQISTVNPKPHLQITGRKINKNRIKETEIETEINTIMENGGNGSGDGNCCNYGNYGNGECSSKQEFIHHLMREYFIPYIRFPIMDKESFYNSKSSPLRPPGLLNDRDSNKDGKDGKDCKDGKYSKNSNNDKDNKIGDVKSESLTSNSDTTSTSTSTLPANAMQVDSNDSNVTSNENSNSSDDGMKLYDQNYLNEKCYDIKNININGNGNGNDNSNWKRIDYCEFLTDSEKERINICFNSDTLSGQYNCGFNYRKRNGFNKLNFALYDCLNCKVSDKIEFRDRAGKYYKAFIKKVDKSASKFTVGYIGWNIESTVTFNDKFQRFRIAKHTANRECRRYLPNINHKETFPIGTKVQIYDYKNQQWTNSEIIKQRYGRVLEVKKVNYISKNCYHCDELNEFRLDPSHKVDKLERKKIWEKIQSPTAATAATAQNLRFMAGVAGVSGTAAGINNGINNGINGINGVNSINSINGNGVGRVSNLHQLNRIRGLNFGGTGIGINNRGSINRQLYAGGRHNDRNHRNLRNHRNHSNHDIHGNLRNINTPNQLGSGRSLIRSHLNLNQQSQQGGGSLAQSMSINNMNNMNNLSNNVSSITVPTPFRISVNSTTRPNIPQLRAQAGRNEHNGGHVNGVNGNPRRVLRVTQLPQPGSIGAGSSLVRQPIQQISTVSIGGSRGNSNSNSNSNSNLNTNGSGDTRQPLPNKSLGNGCTSARGDSVDNNCNDNNNDNDIDGNTGNDKQSGKDSDLMNRRSGRIGRQVKKRKKSNRKRNSSNDSINSRKNNSLSDECIDGNESDTSSNHSNSNCNSNSNSNGISDNRENKNRNKSKNNNNKNNNINTNKNINRNKSKKNKNRHDKESQSLKQDHSGDEMRSDSDVDSDENGKHDKNDKHSKNGNIDIDVDDMVDDNDDNDNEDEDDDYDLVGFDFVNFESILAEAESTSNEDEDEDVVQDDNNDSSGENSSSRINSSQNSDNTDNCEKERHKNADNDCRV